MRAAALPALPILLGFGLAGALFPAAARAQAKTTASTTAKEFRIQAVLAFEGKVRQGDAAAILVRVENLGADAAGMLIVGDYGGRDPVRYPVALPRGAKKEVPVSMSSTGGTQILLQTDRGTIEIHPFQATEPARTSLLAVGDAPGSLAFLENLEPVQSARKPGASSNDGPSRQVVVSYARPAAVPESEAGLDRISCVALFPGSERLNARQISALRRYVLRGGSLALIGGASAPILADSRLADLVPYSALTPGEATVGGQTVSIQRPTARPGVETVPGVAIPVLRLAYGAGRVVYFAADPTEGGLERVKGRAKVLASALELQRAAQMARSPMEHGAESVLAGSPLPAGPGESDPFALPIPPTRSILVVLGAYFVIVLPINFLVLRAFRRLELAWFTAPLLALAFAGVLFRNAGSLYKTGLSRATQTTIFAASGEREGIALGAAQIFFPNATTGPIPIDGAEAIGPDLYRSTEGYDSYSRRDRARPLGVFVTDRPAIPEYASTALEFRDLEFRQTIDLGRGIRVVQSGAQKRPRLEVFNDSPYSLREISVIPAGARSVGSATTQSYGGTVRGRASYSETRTSFSYPAFGTSGSIPPGQHRVCATPGSVASGALASGSWTKSPFLIATIDGAPVGPQLGTVVRSRTTARIAVSGTVADGSSR